MKRYGYLFEKITNLDNIILAHKNARKGKAHYREVQAVDKDVVEHCRYIQKILLDNSYIPSEYKIFKKIDRDKEREIYKLAYFPDRIIHHAIMQILEPIWKPSMIHDTYQSIKGRGTHNAIKKLRKWRDEYSKDTDLFVLKLDIKKFYPSIDNQILKDIVCWKIKCPKTIKLIYKIIDSCNGVPIGNYISQYFGNIYLTKIDHKASKTNGIRYLRYCDDIIILSDSKSILWSVYKSIKEECNNLKLEIKKPFLTKLTNLKGVDTLGYVMCRNRILLRKRIKYSALSVTLEDSLHSYVGWTLHCNGYNLKKKIKGDYYANKNSKPRKTRV